MRRWLIAIFAIHFFLNVGLFAIGKIDTHGADQADSAPTIAQLAGNGHPAQSDGLMGAAPDHALTDAQADLPEVLAVTIALASSAAATLHPAPPLAVKLIFPCIEGPRRPPRPDAATA